MSATDPGEHPRDPIGSLGEEFAKLLGALSGCAGESEEHFATGAPECTVCPVCRAVHAVREVSPEVKEHLRSAGVSLLHAASGLLAAFAAEAPRDEQRHSTGVEHIDLDDDGPASDGEEQ